MAKVTENERATFDAYRRFVHMFGDVVMGVDHEYFEDAFSEVKEKYGAVDDTEVPAEGVEGVGKEVQERSTGNTRRSRFPRILSKQLLLAIHAVFRSWNAPRAVRYREINHLHGYLGTAVTVQAMVFGNLDDSSGTGVCFTRNPATGEDKLYGEFLVNAQGEDVVAGIRTPRDVQEMAEWNPKVLEELRGDEVGPRGPLQGHAGPGVHHRGGQPLHAPEPARSADRSGCREDRRGHGGAGDHHPGRSAGPDPTPGHDPVPPSELFPRRQG